MSLSIRQLRIFEATARLERLTLAADEQALSQSAASQSLRELEHSLGYPLFQRQGRELQLTDAGMELLPQVRQMLGILQTIEHPDRERLSGTLRIAASVTIACYLLPGLCARFLQQYPDVVPEIEICNTQEVINRLDRGQVQIGLIEGPSTPPRQRLIPWLEDQLALFCHPDHPLASPGRISLQQMQSYRWILREPGSGTRAVFDQALQNAGGIISQSLCLNRQEAIKQMVKAGLGIGCLSQLAINEEIKSGELSLLNSDLNLNRRLSIVVNPHTSPLAEAFIQLLEEPAA